MPAPPLLCPLRPVLPLPTPQKTQYASFAGIIGVVVYAQSCGLPILLIGYFGGQVTRDMP